MIEWWEFYNRTWYLWTLGAAFIVFVTIRIADNHHKKDLIKRAERRPARTNLPRGALKRRYYRVRKQTQEMLQEMADICDEVEGCSELPAEIREEAGDISMSIFSIRSYGN